MKDYKRLTETRNGYVIDKCCNCPNVNNPQGCTDKKCYEIMKNRLADLEDKIERGEIDYVADKDKEIASLTAENDKLRARLENAVELPTMGEFKIVDLHTNFYQIAYAVLYKSKGKLYIYQCFDKAKAEVKLKEVGGGENESRN